MRSSTTKSFPRPTQEGGKCPLCAAAQSPLVAWASAVSEGFDWSQPAFAPTLAEAAIAQQFLNVDGYMVRPAPPSSYVLCVPPRAVPRQGRLPGPEAVREGRPRGCLRTMAWRDVFLSSVMHTYPMISSREIKWL